MIAAAFATTLVFVVRYVLLTLPAPRSQRRTLAPAIVPSHESEGPLTRRGPLRLKNPEFFLPLPLVSRLLNEQAPVTKVPKHGAH
jgi:hypothetical protein